MAESQKGKEILALARKYKDTKKTLKTAIEEYKQAKEELKKQGITEKENPLEEIAETNTKTITAEQILTVSARDYCESLCKRLSDYEMIGMQIEYCNARDTNRLDLDEAITELIEKVPKDTEAIVEFKQLKPMARLRPTSYLLSGTALIPKIKSIDLKMFEDQAWEIYKEAKK